MHDSATTRPSLLVRIRDPADNGAWSQFVDLYAPLVYGFARKHGLQDADAADVTQDVLRAVARGARRLDYDPRRGTFRGWLFTVVRNKLRDFLAGQARHGVELGHDSALANVPGSPPPDEQLAEDWRREHERQLFAWAARQVAAEVRESTWQAFWLTAVDGRSGQEVAQQLGISVAAVYLAKSRAMARLKALVAEADE